ncbi:MAG: quinone-dependent dihydroorotate dehydrogenase [Bacteroidia bacterium]|nr:MAG: quinone-dependent dihydroorotate dehydrogenase [Bacteroidia bacterium]
MYKSIIRPLLFLFPPEWIHRVVNKSLPLVCRIPFVSQILRKHYLIRDTRLQRTLFGIQFPNPAGIAAGFDKEAAVYNALANFGFGYVEIGTVTPLPQKGNPKPRLFRLPDDQALINRMGFNNHGVEAFAAKLRRNKPEVIIGGNIGKNTLTPNEDAPADYLYCFEKLFELVDYFVINVSCPNIKGMNALQDRKALMKILNAVQENNLSRNKPKPVLLKISPDLTEPQLDDVLSMIEEARLDGIVATNTTSLRDDLITDPKIIKKTGEGGLSGNPLRNKSLRTIKYLHKMSRGKVPIIGVGGIMTAEDALETLEAGASLVQVYTGFVYNGPSLGKKINNMILTKMAGKSV